MIKLDISATSVVVTCTDCPYWYAFAWDRIGGYRSAERHLVAAHDIEPARAAERRRQYERRHAARA